MPSSNISSPKPVSEEIRPQITRLPPLTFWRCQFRAFVRLVFRILVWLFIRAQVSGLDNVPKQGSALIVSNHLGDADLALGICYSPRMMEALSKAELHDFPLIGKLMDAYGVIWVHRGQPDRRALRAALQGLEEGRLVSIAPEGRESLTGALEEGTHGASFIALKANVPVLPVTFTGTENKNIYPNIKRLRRTPVTITIGSPFWLETGKNMHAAVRSGTQTIMETLAEQLPPAYRGIYQNSVEEVNGSG